MNRYIYRQTLISCNYMQMFNPKCSMYGIFTLIYPPKLPKCRQIGPYIEHLGTWTTFNWQLSPHFAFFANREVTVCGVPESWISRLKSSSFKGAFKALQRGSNGDKADRTCEKTWGGSQEANKVVATFQLSQQTWSKHEISGWWQLLNAWYIYRIIYPQKTTQM